MIFALALVPIVIAAGAGLDFSRAMIVRSQLGEALDAAGLAVGSASTLSDAQIKTLATSYFNANFKLDSSFGTPTPLQVARDTIKDQVTLTTSVQMPTVLMKVAGVKSMPVSFTSTIVWGQTKLWVSLVLDNTGSMCEPDRQPCTYDNNPDTKINTLKSATHNLLAMLKNASAKAGDVKVSIVPFNKDVAVDPSSYNASWLRWSDWDGSNTNWSYQCQWVSSRHGGHYDCGYVQVTANHDTWNGCITDRDQDYDTKVTAPSGSSTYFPTEQYSSCPTTLVGLTDNWSALSDKVDAMYATGNTNQTIGFVWGWQALTDGNPMNSGTLPDETQRVIILLSDGLNTENRFSSSQSSIDSREKKACDNAKAAGIVIYTVFVDIGGSSGNSAPLQYCASDSTKYFDLTSADQMNAAFQTIGTQITNLRVAK